MIQLKHKDRGGSKMKLTGYVFTPKQDILGSHIFSTIATYAKYSKYSDTETEETESLEIWVYPYQLWLIKRYLNKFTNLEYTLEKQ